jgi:hypothetical protein
MEASQNDNASPDPEEVEEIDEPEEQATRATPSQVITELGRATTRVSPCTDESTRWS